MSDLVVMPVPRAPSTPCSNCRQRYDVHIEEKCPFDSSSFEPDPWYELAYKSSMLLRTYLTEEDLPDTEGKTK